MYNVVQRMTIVNIIRMNVICKFQICRVNCVSIVNLEKSLCGIRIMLVCVCTRVVSSFCYRPTCTTNNNKNLPLLSVIHKYLSIPDPDLNRLRAQKRPAINIFDPFLPHCEKFSASCKREKNLCIASWRTS
jgi:hypothetical protein